MPKAWLHPQKRRRENNYARKGPTEGISYLVLILDLSWAPVGTEESEGTCSPGFLPIALCSLAMDASFSLVEKKWIQIQIWEGAIICSACGNYVCIPHQDRIQLLELAAGHTARTRAVRGIHSPLVCAVQSLSPPSLQVRLALILRNSASSDAAKLLIVWLPGEIALPSCLLAPMSISVRWAASRECCLRQVWLCARAWFWLSGNAKIIKCNTCDSGKGLRESRRAWSKRGHPRRKTDAKWHAKCERERADYGEAPGRKSMVQACVCGRAAAARCHKLRNQGVGREWEGAGKDLWVVWGILI